MLLLSQVPKPWLVIAGVGLVLSFGLLDTLSGQEISFSVFYMLPIYMVTWHVGRWPGVGLSIFSALTWLVADYASAHVISHTLIPLWNMLVRLFFFLLMTYLLSELQKTEQRRRLLERIFFHDILNLLGSVRGFAELLKDKEVVGTQEVYDLLYQTADKSIEDIEAQRLLTSVENNDFRIEPSEINSRLLINLIVNLYRHQKIARGRTIKVADATENLAFISDQSILSRVFGNMLKNALEDTSPGGTVTIGCRREKDMVCFWVHNEGVIPEQIRQQIFRQSVSTKGRERGIGTYSMKVLSECLQGKISFSSNRQDGTTFKACYPLRLPSAAATGSDATSHER